MILAIYCAGGLGMQTLELAWAINRWEKIIFVDDVTEEKFVSGVPVYRFDELEQFGNNVEFVIANGEPAYRKMLFDKIESSKYPFTNIISPWTPVLTGTKIGKGCIIFDAGISVSVEIGDNVFIDSKAIIGHHTSVKSHCVISAMVFAGGHTEISEQVYVAPGAMLKDRIKIGESAIISMGAVVLRSVKALAIMVGNPAKKIGENTERKVFSLFG